MKIVATSPKFSHPCREVAVRKKRSARCPDKTAKEQCSEEAREKHFVASTERLDKQIISE